MLFPTVTNSYNSHPRNHLCSTFAYKITIKRFSALYLKMLLIYYLRVVPTARLAKAITYCDRGPEFKS